MAFTGVTNAHEPSLQQFSIMQFYKSTVKSHTFQMTTYIKAFLGRNFARFYGDIS